MKNINKNLIYLLIIITFVFGIFIATNANASEGTMVRTGVTFIPDPTVITTQDSTTSTSSTNGSTANKIVNTLKGNPVPNIYSISPNSDVLLVGSFITVYGSNFMPTSVVRFNSSDHTTTYIDSKTLQFKLNSSDTSKIGNYSVTVANMGPGGGISNAVSFGITKTNVSGNTSNTNDLSANALYSGKGFMPSTFMQWVFVFILILLIVALYRKLYERENYEKQPLKHA